MGVVCALLFPPAGGLPVPPAAVVPTRFDKPLKNSPVMTATRRFHSPVHSRHSHHLKMPSGLKRNRSTRVCLVPAARPDPAHPYSPNSCRGREVRAWTGRFSQECVMTESAAGASPTGRHATGSRRELAAASVGTVVEAFDWSIYAVLAPYFAPAIFPVGNEVAQLLAAYLVFAVGFLARPLGVVIMGRVADLRGRKFALILSVGMIAACSLLMAAVPTAEHIGWGAALLVVVLRCVQGISLSVEQNAAITYAVETALPRRRYLSGAVVASGLFVGNLLVYATLAVLLLVFTSEGTTAGGWRLGFVVAGFFGLVALWIRSGAEESDAFRRDSSGAGRKQWPLLRAHVRPLVAIFLMTTGVVAANYFFTVSLPVYLDDVGAVPRETSSAMMPVVLGAFIGLTIVAGMVADRVGGLWMARLGAICVAVAVVPITMAMVAGRLPFLPGILLFVAFFAIGFSPTGTLVTQLVPVSIRVTGVGIAGTLAVILAGGTLPLVVQALTAAGRQTFVPWYIAALAVVSLAGALIVRSRDLYTESPHDGPEGTTAKKHGTDRIVADVRE
ncbi:MFS transporter [Thermopolyspora sp. NPDC052614]|uniref:MFS transporter n=1 Tax=Thermopolyspora sp. NPDC052614 TaxID=3155682 RepID=UPI0034479C1C